MLLLKDRLLLKRFREGERQAMETVFKYYSEPLAQFLQRGFSFQSQGQYLRFKGLLHRHDLHDILAETFRRCFEDRARLAYDGVVPYESYLKVVRVT